MDTSISKKRVFFAIHYMEIGGAERSLLGLLDSFDTDRYDVDLFIYQHTGEFMSFISEKINLLPESKKYSTIERPILEILREGFLDIAIARLIAKFRAKRYIQKNSLKDSSSTFQYISNHTTPLLPPINKHVLYDMAISFVPPHNIVRDKVKAKKKIAWIHTDYSSIEINSTLEFPVWDSFDHIVAISKSAELSFVERFPALSDKTVVFENILSPLFVREQAELEGINSEMPDDDGVIKLLSIGRYSEAKNFENVPYMCRDIVRSGINVKWYIIGYGGGVEEINKSIGDTAMEGKVILLGKKSNPYPYIKACDIYIQPSRYEGKAVTVREAQMLFKPVAITRFPTADSQLKDTVDGVIVPMDNEGAAKGIIELIKNKELQTRLIKNMKTLDFGNEAEINKLYDLI